MAKIVTGHTGVPHIESVDVQALNRGIFGNDDYVITPEVASVTRVGNVYTMPAMDMVIQGVHCRLDGTEQVTIDWTTSGMKRYDLIVGRYRIGNDGIESFNLEVIKGTAKADSPSKPTGKVNNLNIADGAEVRDMVLYSVLVNGTTGLSISREFKIGDIASRINFAIGEVVRIYNELASRDIVLEDSIREAKTTAAAESTSIRQLVDTKDRNMKTYVDGKVSDLGTTIGDAENSVRTAFRAADTALKEDVESDYKTRINNLKNSVKPYVNDALGMLGYFGKVAATPTGAGVKTTIHVDIPASASGGRVFSSAPTVVITPVATKPSSITSYSVANVTTMGFDIIFYRSEKVETNFSWAALGQSSGGRFS